MISVVTCSTIAPGARGRGALSRLAEARSLSAAARLERETDRDSLLAAHLAARVAVAVGVHVRVATVRLERRCPQCGSEEHGVPSATGPFGRAFVSISHTSGFAAAAASPTMAVGIDAESTRSRKVWESVVDAAFPARERAMVLEDESGDLGRALWVRKEALAKLGAIGLGLEQTHADVGPVSDQWMSTAHGCVRSLPSPQGVAVALAASRPASVDLHDHLSVPDLIALAERAGR